MANPDAAQVSSLPLPPVQYINQYTEENVRRGRAPRPPPPPLDTYSMFGNAFGADDAIIRPLESQGIRRLYHQHCDRRKELRKLNHSLLVNFLDLLDLLVQCPDSPRRAEKVEDLSLLFIHVHHLLNEFRPHQARETLRVMLELQMRQRHETAQRFQRHLERALETVQNALQALPEPARAPDADPLASAQDSGTGGAGEAAACDASARDRLMCAIVDAMP